MGKPSHKDYKLYRATIGLTSKDGDEHAFEVPDDDANHRADRLEER